MSVPTDNSGGTPADRSPSGAPRGTVFILVLFAVLLIVTLMIGEQFKTAEPVLPPSPSAPSVAAVTASSTTSSSTTTVLAAPPPTTTSTLASTTSTLPQPEAKGPPTAVIFLVDKSRSMAYDGKIELARKIVSDSIKALPSNDIVAVVGYDSTQFVVIRPAKVAEVLPILERRISNLTPMGRTNLVGALNYSCQALGRIEARARHLIVLGDGKVPVEGDEILRAVQCNTKLGIKISSISIGIDPDRPFLEMLAKFGKGELWLGSDPAVVKALNQLLMRP